MRALGQQKLVGHSSTEREEMGRQIRGAGVGPSGEKPRELEEGQKKKEEMVNILNIPCISPLLPVLPFVLKSQPFILPQILLYVCSKGLFIA